MFMVASVGACVGVLMGMTGSRLLVAGEMIFGEHDFQSGALEGSPENSLSLNRVALERKQPEGFTELFDVESRVDKGSKGHIAAAAAERLKIGDFSHLAGAGNSSGSVKAFISCYECIRLAHFLKLKYTLVWTGLRVAGAC
jgi:hypothetical protein